MTPSPCILVLEDNPDDLALIIRAIERDALDARVQSASNRAEFLARLTPEVDLVLSDHSLPDIDALEALRLVRDSGLDTPLIIVSGTITEEHAVAALGTGAVDYVVKDRLGRLMPAVKRALEHQKVRQEKAALSALIDAERAQHRYAFEHAPAFIARVQGPEHIFEIANPAYYRLVGHRDLIGQRVRDVLSEVVEQGLIDRLDAVYATGEPFAVTEMPIQLQRAPDARPEERYVSFIYLPVRGAGDATTGVFCHGVDVTEQVLARQTVERASRDNQMILDYSLDAICTIDREGRFVRVSAAAETLWGYAPDELVGRPFVEFVAEEDRAKTLAATERIMGGEEVTGFENRYLRKDGQVVTQLWSARWLEADGLMFCVARDISELVRQRAELATSEQRFRTLVETSAKIIWTADETGCVTEQGAAWEQFTGQTKQEGRGWGWTETLHPDDLARITPSIQELLVSKRAYEFEYRVRRRDGVYHWFSVRGAPVFDAAGRFVEWIGACTDIQSRKQAEDALKESETRYRLLFDNSLDGVMLTAPDGRVLKANPAMCAMLGYTEEEICRLGRAGLVDTIDPQLAESLAERERSGSFRGELTLIRKDGSTVPVELSTAVYADPSGEQRTSMFVRDITALRSYTEALVEAKEKAEEMSRLKSSFLTNMSHEIRTPLTGIIGFSELLAEEITGKGQELALMMNESGYRLLETLDSVLELARLTSGNVRLSLQPLDLMAEVKRALTPFYPRFRETGLKTEVRPHATKISVVADQNGLGRVLMNLLANALKFTSEGGVTITIDRDGAYGVIHVSDTGIGIAPSFLPHLFEEFKQESEGMAREYEGNGIGLPITKRLVDLMGGEIRVSSTKGKGSIFSVYLPLDHSAVDPPSVQAVAPGAQGRQPRLLVVENNPEVLLLMHRRLSPIGQVDAAETANAAIERLATSRYDLAIIDIELSGAETGVDVLRAMRAMPGYRATPALACTAYALPEDRARFIELGFDGYLHKPFSRDQLLGAVGDLLHKIENEHDVARSAGGAAIVRTPGE